MREVEVDALVRGVWAAATGEISWVAALDPVAAHFGARMAVVQRFDLANQCVLAIESGGAPDLEDGVLQYLRHFHQQDRRKASLLEGRVVPHGGWYHDHEHLDAQFVATDPFYQHFLPAYGCRFVSGRTHAPAPDQACLFALELSPQRGPLNADERAELDRLGTHLDEALRAYERLRRARAQVLAGHQLLHDFAQPMWLIDTDRVVHDANAAALGEAQSGRLLLQRGAHLVGATARLDRALAAEIHTLAGLPHRSWRVLRQQLPALAQPLWLHLSLLRPDASAGAFGAQPMLLATLFDPQQVPAFEPYALSSLLDLTPAQARVAAGLAQGRTAEEMAASGGTQVSTVRSHLAAVLQRVGASRGDDLVRRLHDGHLLWGAAPGG
jgi:DNA-binding CsgD family transcriptional regulator